MTVQPERDASNILNIHGHNYTRKIKNINMGGDPIYGQGTVSWGTSSVTGLFDQYNLAEKMFGFGRIETGNARIILEGDTSIDDEDRLVDDTGTYEVTRVLNWDYGGELAYKIAEVDKL